MASSKVQEAELVYLRLDEKFLIEKPYQVFVPLPEGVPEQLQSNMEFGRGEMQLIYDIRESNDEFSLDVNGFTVCQHHTKMLNFTEDEKIEQVYLPEVACLLQNHITDAHKVVIFDWRARKVIFLSVLHSLTGFQIRKSIQVPPMKVINMDDKMVPLQPACHVHIDQTPWSAMKRVKLHAPEEVEHLAEKRFSIVNAWRPIVDHIEDWPLAVCDGRSVPTDKLIAVDHVRRRYVGESYYIPFSQQYRWHYLSRQTRDEVLLIKNYDSGDVEGKYCPHASFHLNDAPMTAIPRESIEVRALIFYSTKSQ